MVQIDEKLTELYYDIQVPLWIVETLDKEDKTRMNLELALEATINLLDLREPYSPEFYTLMDNALEYVDKAVYQI